MSFAAVKPSGKQKTLTDNENAVTSNEELSENNSLIDLDSKRMETLTNEKHPQHQETGFGTSNIQITNENVTRNKVFGQRFVSPVHGVYFTFYERFVDRDLNSFVVTTRFHRHILIRERFLGFTHRLLEIVNTKVDRSWKPKNSLGCKMNWTGRCPEYLQSLKCRKTKICPTFPPIFGRGNVFWDPIKATISKITDTATFNRIIPCTKYSIFPSAIA